MRMRSDGSVQSSNVPTHQNMPKRKDYSLYRCMVEKVLYIDDTNNITTNASNPEVLYDVIIMGGPKAGQKISNCRLSSDLGGNNNFYERILKASTKKFAIDALTQHDGDVVFVQFTQGHSGYPVIMAADGGVKTALVIGAKKLDGPRSRRKFNGIFEETNNFGEYTFIRHGGSLKGDEFIPNSTSEYTRKVLRNEVVRESFLSGMTVVKDGKNDKMTITTQGGVTMDIDGKNGKITLTAKDTVITIDGNSGKITLSGKFIDLGERVSDLVTRFTDLATAFAIHTHPFIDITPGGPVPSVTMPPIAPLLSSIGSQTVKVQD